MGQHPGDAAQADCACTCRSERTDPGGPGQGCRAGGQVAVGAERVTVQELGQQGQSSAPNSPQVMAKPVMPSGHREPPSRDAPSLTGHRLTLPPVSLQGQRCGQHGAASCGGHGAHGVAS